LQAVKARLSQAFDQPLAALANLKTNLSQSQFGRTICSPNALCL